MNLPTLALIVLVLLLAWLYLRRRQGAENEPTFLLGEEVVGTAFRVHPYHHDTIGDMCDLETISHADLWRHYQSYYGPNNAVAVAVGDFEAPQMLDRIERLVVGIREIGDNIAHDLKSPVARIRGMAEISISGESSGGDDLTLAGSTIEECDRLLDMINTMLMISKSDVIFSSTRDSRILLSSG